MRLRATIILKKHYQVLKIYITNMIDRKERYILRLKEESKQKTKLDHFKRFQNKTEKPSPVETNELFNQKYKLRDS